MNINAKNSFLLSLILFILDRITKHVALAHQWQEYSLTPFLSFDLVFNRGVTAGFLYWQTSWAYLILSLCILCITLSLLWYTYNRIKENKCIIGELLTLSGAISNLIDRAFYPGVIDFIHLHVGEWSFPIFNIADVCIVVGVIFMFFEHVWEN